MKRIDLRSSMGWQLFDFWAFVIVAILAIVLILFKLVNWPGADQCCNTNAVSDKVVVEKIAVEMVDPALNNQASSPQTNAWMHQDTSWPGCEASLSATYLGFDSASVILSHKGKTILNKLQSCLEKSSYTIIGHTDNVGTKNSNLLLSTKRAKSVRDYLVEQGIDANILSVKGVGELDPIADNATEIGRQRNRRIEFINN